MLNLKEACEYLKVSKSTIRRWEREGVLTSIRTSGNHRRYDETTLGKLILSNDSDKKMVIGYSRVSTNGQKEDLERQTQLITNYCAAKGYSFKIITDIGSGMNYNKKGFKELIKLCLNKEISKIVVNYKDRLVRFGYEILEEICLHNNIEIEIINHTDDKTYEAELVEDVLSIITVFSAKLHGSRSHKNKIAIEENKKIFSI